jgi:hypothetical protein
MPHPPSPFRLVLKPDGGRPRHVECHSKIQHIDGAMRKATEFAADVGVSGSIEVYERVGSSGWTVRGRVAVKNSVVTGKWSY